MEPAMPRRLLSSLPSFLLLLPACDQGPTVPPVPPPLVEPDIRLQSVDMLVPGQEARIRGVGMRAVDSLWVDNVVVREVRAESDEVAAFTVPVLRECEADGRRVLVALPGGSALETRIAAGSTMDLAVGESRVLSAAELECLRLPARDEDYVLSVANTDLPTGTSESVRTLLRVRTLPSHPSAGASGGPYAALGPWLAGRAGPNGRTTSLTHEPGSSLAGPMRQGAGVPSAAPPQFDPRYATAMTGDTVTMVAWSWNGAEALRICGLPREEVPTFPALVIGASGNIVAAVDLRYPRAAGVIAQAQAGWLDRALELAAPVLLPAMRSIFDPAYQPLAGGGGRYYVLFTERIGGHALDGHLPGATGWFQADCPHTSEMTVMTAPVSMLDTPVRDATLTSKFIIHEYAHSAEYITAARHDLYYSALWAEPWAVLAEETAARISSQQPQGGLLHRHHPPLVRGRVRAADGGPAAGLGADRGG
jgi:hypothetical protein